MEQAGIRCTCLACEVAIEIGDDLGLVVRGTEYGPADAERVIDGSRRYVSH